MPANQLAGNASIYAIRRKIVLAQDLNLGLRFCNLISLSYDGFDLKACTTGGYHFLIDSSGQYKKG